MESASIWHSRANVAALLAVFLGAVDLTVVATILPSMIGDLGINTADIDRYIWVVNAYLIAYVVSIPLAGRIADTVGIRAVFIAATVIFIGGSVLCATATTLEDLIVARAVQGFGGGALLPVALSLAARTFTGARRAEAVGAVGAIDTLGWVAGPTYGAIVVGVVTWSDEPWRLVFWLNVPLGLGLLAVARWLPGEALEPATGTWRERILRIDPLGFALLSVFLVAINVALASGGEIGATAGRGLRAFGGTPNPLADLLPVLLVVALVALGLLIVHLARSSHPMLPRALVRIRAYRASLIANALLGTVLMAGMVNVPVVVALSETGGEGGGNSALLLAPFTVTISIASIASGALLRHFDAARIATVGIAVAVLGNLSIYPLLALPGYGWMAVGLAVAGLGLGLALTPLSTTALDASTRETVGTAASSLLVFRLLGMTVGVSLLTSLGVQRLQVLTGALPTITRGAEESTAAFLTRQQDFLVNEAIPLGVQVVQETFLVAALLTALALIPALRLGRGAAPDP